MMVTHHYESLSKTQTIKKKWHFIEYGAYAINKELENEDIDMLSMMMYVKDHLSISGSAYPRVCKLTLRHYKPKEKIAELNGLWDIKPISIGYTRCVAILGTSATKGS